MSAIQLTDHQLHALAHLIAQELKSHSTAVAAGPAAQKEACLVDAAGLARALGLSRRFVYEHATELGAIRIGKGSKPRLRFDVEAARAAMCCSSGEGSQAAIPSAGGGSRRQRRQPGAREPNHLPLASELLGFRGSKAQPAAPQRGAGRSGVDLRRAA